MVNPVTYGQLGNYSLSAAIGNVTTSEPNYNLVPGRDFFGNPRPEAGNDNVFDAGAVEFPATVTVLPPFASSLSPTSGALGTTVTVTLTGANMTSVSWSSTAPSPVSFGNWTVSPGGVTATATIQIPTTSTSASFAVSVLVNGTLTFNGTFTVTHATIAMTAPTPALTTTTANTTTKSGTVTVNNTATGATAGPFTFTAAPALNAGAPAGFTLTGGTCANGVVILPGGSCTVIVQYAPPSTATANANLVLTGTGISTPTVSGASFSGN